MYIRLTKNGDIIDYSNEVLVFFGFTPVNLDCMNYFDLVRRDMSKSIVKRFIRKVISNLHNELIIPFKINALVNWTEWSFHLGVNNDIIAIGKDITCVKKIEPIIKAQNIKLRKQNKGMVDSIIYAKQIQMALLPSMDLIANFKSTFVIYEPKDIVSGDFYWFHKIDSRVVIISIDCTGHGVPGALMTVLVNTLLNEIIKLDEVEFPHQILTLLDSKLTKTLQSNGKVIKDGLDIAVGLFDFKTKVLSFSGALQNIQIVSGNVMGKLIGERYPVGYYPYCNKRFKTSDIQLQTGDRFYFYSDGIIDQFGGEFDKKIGSKRFNAKLLNTYNLSMDKQRQSILEFYDNWKGKNEQIDDVLLMGFEV